MLTEAITSVLQGKWIGHEQHGGVHLLDKVKTAEDRFLCVSFGAAFTLCFHIIPRNEPDTIVPLFSQKCRRQNKVVFLFWVFYLWHLRLESVNCLPQQFIPQKNKSFLLRT